MNDRPLVIYGAGGHARELADLIEDVNAERPSWELLGFLTEDAASWQTQLNGFPVLGGPAWLDAAPPDLSIVIAIGSTRSRREVASRLRPRRLAFPTLRHPTAQVSRHARIGDGGQVMAGCIVTTNVVIGEFALLNRCANVSHDCRLGDFVTLAPGVQLSGRVAIGDGVDVGVGASVIQGVTIGGWSVIGAGAAVIRDLPGGCTAVGVPARVLGRAAS